MKRHSLLRPVLAVLLVCGFLLAAQDSAFAFAHKKKGKPAQIQLLESKANKGDPNAQFSLGSSYEKGKGVGKNKEKAIEWYYKAGQSYLKKGKKDKAKAALAAINRLSPGHARAVELTAALKK